MKNYRKATGDETPCERCVHVAKPKQPGKRFRCWLLYEFHGLIAVGRKMTCDSAKAKKEGEPT